MAKKGQKFNKYNNYELKEQIIREKLEQGLSTPYLSKKYGIPTGTIYTWLYQYRHKRGKIVKEKQGRPRKEENENYKEKYEILKKYIDFLEEVDREKK